MFTSSHYFFKTENMKCQWAALKSCPRHTSDTLAKSSRVAPLGQGTPVHVKGTVCERKGLLCPGEGQLVVVVVVR